MDRHELRGILKGVRQGTLSIEDALEAFTGWPYLSTPSAKLDVHRPLRRGLPEVVYCEGKDVRQVTEIYRSLAEIGQPVLGTRAKDEHYQAVREALPDVEYDPVGRLLRWLPEGSAPAGDGGEPGRGAHPDPPIAVVSAGSADEPVLREAAGTLEAFGHRVTTIVDSGVAGLHRILDHLDTLRKAPVVIVVAGMDGALPSVVAGLIDSPVIAVPTSVGYGASFGGLSALLAMLNNCAGGVTVVNIDNGFGAAYAASLIVRKGMQRAGLRTRSESRSRPAEEV